MAANLFNGILLDPIRSRIGMLYRSISTSSVCMSHMIKNRPHVDPRYHGQLIKRYGYEPYYHVEGLLPSLKITNTNHRRYMHRYQQDTLRLMYARARSFDAVKYKDRLASDWAAWNYQSELFAFSRRLQENLSENTLRTIFTFKCYLDNLAKEQKDLGMKGALLDIKCNEELIELGFKLLNSFIKPYLRFTFDKMPEDGIEEITNYLLSQEVLQDIAMWIGCHDVILCASLPPSKEKLADSVKALVAGIELDFGQDKAKHFVIDFIMTYLNEKDILDDIWRISDPSITLKMILKNAKMSEYEPRIMFHTGINTIESCYVVGLYVDKKLIGYGPGENLKIAEISAALDSLQRMWDIKESRAPLLFGEDAYTVDYTKYSSKHPALKDWCPSTVENISNPPNDPIEQKVRCQ